MSRLNEIIDNHQNLDQLLSIVKHYGVSAEYVSAALIGQLNKESEESEEAEESEDEASAGEKEQLVKDLTQFYARF